MLKFMAWERNFENRVLKVRNRELKYQQLNYTIEVRPLHAYWQVYNAENLITYLENRSSGMPSGMARLSLSRLCLSGTFLSCADKCSLPPSHSRL